MAPMAVGGNLPYRRLCREYGADLTCSEMVLADKLVKGGEGPLLRSHPSEDTFGVQLCGKHADTLAEAARLAVDRGARFIDLNFGCPIDLVVQRGAGAALLKKPRKLAELVAAVRDAVTVPLSVKIRTGYSEDRQNAAEVALAGGGRGCRCAGASRAHAAAALQAQRELADRRRRRVVPAHPGHRQRRPAHTLGPRTPARRNLRALLPGRSRLPHQAVDLPRASRRRAVVPDGRRALGRDAPLPRLRPRALRRRRQRAISALTASCCGTSASGTAGARTRRTTSARTCPNR